MSQKNTSGKLKDTVLHADRASAGRTMKEGSTAPGHEAIPIEF